MRPIRIATWNINSVRARSERLLRWLNQHQPDVLCLQELKAPSEAFPVAEIHELGYHVSINGQKTYNGVAVLSKTSIQDVKSELDGDTDDTQARYLEVRISDIRVICIYVPNGAEVGSDKFLYKINWLHRLQHRLQHLDQRERIVVCGDFNIAPHDIDVAKIEQWQDSTLCHESVRTEFQKILQAGWRDVVREKNPGQALYSWWDYRMLGFPKNNGLRIDHILCSATLADACKLAMVDRDERKGTKPSDHAPVIAEFSRSKSFPDTNTT